MCTCSVIRICVTCCPPITAFQFVQSTRSCSQFRNESSLVRNMMSQALLDLEHFLSSKPEKAPAGLGLDPLPNGHIHPRAENLYYEWRCQFVTARK